VDEYLKPKYTHLIRTRAYLVSLPEGLASYPACRCKASVWKNILRWTDIRSVVDKIPKDLLGFMDPNILGSSWIPLVHSFVGHLILRDCLFASDDAIYDHFCVVNHRLLSSVLYRVMFAVASPQMAVEGASRRFGALFEGITLRVGEHDKGRVQLILDYPPALTPPLVGRLFLTAFLTAGELAGGKNVIGKVLEYSNTSTTHELTWR
jgi:hypothetical protein